MIFAMTRTAIHAQAVNVSALSIILSELSGSDAVMSGHG
jgi:hypothetical protein